MNCLFQKKYPRIFSDAVSGDKYSKLSVMIFRLSSERVCSCRRDLSSPRLLYPPVDCVWNVMAHAQKPDFVFRRNGRVNLNRRGRQFSRLLTAEVCVSAVVMLDTPCSEVVRKVLATYSIRQFPLDFPTRAAPCAITFQLDYQQNTGLAGPWTGLLQ